MFRSKAFILKGPVPTGFVRGQSAPFFWRAVGEAIPSRLSDCQREQYQVIEGWEIKFNGIIIHLIDRADARQHR